MARNHYVSQFILLNICKDNVITYFDLEKHKAESRNPRQLQFQEFVHSGLQLTPHHRIDIFAFEKFAH